MSVAAPSVTCMIIDCGKCAVRGDACADCVVTFLTVPVRPGAAPPATSDGAAEPVAAGLGLVELDAAEQDALGVLADGGLVPPLRLRRVV